MALCKYCGKIFENKKSPNSTQCRSCESAKSRYKIKKKYVNIKGGKCERCGYDKNIGALHFHHLKDKRHNLDSRGMLLLEEQVILEELEKCVLLCANCHHEEHCNYYRFININAETNTKME